MRDKAGFVKRKIFVMLGIFVAILLVVGLLMRSKMQVLLSGYVEEQVAEQGDILAKVLEEDLNAELKGLENIATYIQADNESMGKLIEYACLDEPEALWGVMELGGNVICGAPLATKEFSGIQDSFRGNDAVSYQTGKGILFTVPVFRGSNIKYVLFKFYPEEQLVERFGLNFYGGYGKVFATDREEQIVIPYEGWTEEDLAFFKQDSVLEVFNSISDLMNVSTAAAGFYDDKENSKYLFVSEVGELDIILVGMVEQSIAEEGIASIITLVLWVFGLLLMLLAVGMAFLFGAEEKAMETDELREAKLIADSANQAKSDFLASMSHEIRTPINAVMGMNEMILRECEDESIKEYAVNIQNASKTLLSLINDILDLSKIEAGKMEIVPDNYELSSVLNDVVNMTQIKAKQKKLDFLVDVDEKIPNKLFGDEVRIRQIMLNILNNAVKYTKEGNVHLYVSQEKESDDRIILKIAVKDTGIGIREEDMEKLFGSFERLDTKKNRNVEGTGLGLSITSKMIELMNGKLDVESQYGEGSVFTVRIPQPVVEDTAIGDFGDRFSKYVQSVKSYTESFTAPDAEVLIVDDNEMNLFVTEKLLKNTKVKVTCCESGEKALEQVKKRTFDVILLDHLMEDMDGIETLKQIRSVEASLCKQTPAIALTANAFMGVREMYLSEGFDDYLSKPIVAEKLEEMLRKYIPEEKIILSNGYKNVVKVERKADVQTVVSGEIGNEKKVTPVQKKETMERAEAERKQKVTAKRIENKTVVEKGKHDDGILKEFYHKVAAVLFRDELEIQHKLMNLILLAAFVGGSIAFAISAVLGVSIEGVLIIGSLILVVAACLWIANVKRKPQVAALLIVIVANLVIFPVMYFFCGGIHSGMPIWLVLGMIFSWLILKGKLCFILYSLNVVMVAGCLLLEYYMPELVVPLDGRMAVVFDVLQSIVLVTCIFGAIFKYQTYVYEKQKKEILKANQAKSEFLSNMSHEIRTPINAILGYNEMIMRETSESQTIEYGLNVQSAGRTLLSLVNDILDFASMEKVEWTLNCEPYSTLSLLQDIFAYAEYCTEKKQLEIQLDIDENIPQSLFGDVVRLMQVINNLISNAVKYTKEGYVKISVHWTELSEKQGVLKVQVKDTGIGMKEENLQKISHSFVRFDSQQTRNIQGTGLGLSIVTRLLHLMDSQLDVKSEFGKGSEFYFELVQEIVERAPIGKYERSRTFKLTDTIEECFEAPEVKALVVDDNLTNLDLVKGILKMTQMQIDTAENGKEAVELVRKNFYHIILMDHMMPVMDGIEALQLMRNEKLCEHTPIIVLTANVIQGAKEGYLEAGFDDYLSKPIYSKDLFKTLKKYLPEELQVVSQKESVKEVVSVEAVKEQKTLAERLPSLDVETGLTYCCNSEEFYRDILKSYYESSKYEDIIKSYEAEDWDKYRILVHALKSTSLSIGAAELSEAAKQLEAAAKELNVDYIKEHHNTVIENYKSILTEIKNVLEDKPVAGEEVEAVEDNTFDEVSVLVVDDDAMNLQVASKMLGEYCHVDCVSSGREALEFLDNHHPNLILLDIHMPEMNGFEAIRKIKEDEHLRDIPVIFLTADNDRDSEVQGFREGAMDFVTKPFIADTLIQRVKRILENDHLRKNLQMEVKKQTKHAEERREKVERLSLQITTALADTIDAKDSYTNGHSVRVAKYAKEIAKRVGKTEQEQENIYYAGLLHDIGKIGIPRLIINKTSVLTNDEYEMIKSHSKIGADILENMKDLPELSIGAHWHHERYDGKGYPDRLKGKDIPEIARIIGVADAYDAMTSKRSYRDILPQKVVREEIVKGRGTQFDPEFADIMIQMIDEDVQYENIEK